MGINAQPTLGVTRLLLAVTAKIPDNSVMKPPVKSAPLPPLKPLLHPKHWLSWLLLGLSWLYSRLPFALGMALSRSLKPVIKVLMKKRLAIIEQNLAACFADKSPQERAEMLDQNLTALASMPGETIYIWWRSRAFVERIGSIGGFEHIEAAQREGKGILLLSVHSTCMEIGSSLLTAKTPIGAIYRPHKNPVMEYMALRQRSHKSVYMIKKREVRTAMRYLREGGALWYTADMDMRGEQSLFVPFFGIQTATMTAPLRLAKAGKAVVIPMMPIRLPGNRFRLEILPPLDDFSGDDEKDLQQVNAVLEQMIRMAPEQYWWIHRRFKTRPPGEPPFYSGG